MRVDCALLCEAVTVRGGLLHILGGGVSRLGRPKFPYPLGLSLALRVMVHPTEAERSHTLETRVLDEDGEAIGRLDISFNIGRRPKGLRPGEEVAVPIPINLANLQIKAPGAYSLEILIDGTHMSSVPFVVSEAQQGQGQQGQAQPGVPQPDPPQSQ